MTKQPKEHPKSDDQETPLSDEELEQIAGGGPGDSWCTTHSEEEWYPVTPCKPSDFREGCRWVTG